MVKQLPAGTGHWGVWQAKVACPLLDGRQSYACGAAVTWGSESYQYAEGLGIIGLDLHCCKGQFGFLQSALFLIDLGGVCSCVFLAKQLLLRSVQSAVRGPVFLAKPLLLRSVQGAGACMTHPPFSPALHW